MCARLTVHSFLLIVNDPSENILSSLLPYKVTKIGVKRSMEVVAGLCEIKIF